MLKHVLSYLDINECALIPKVCHPQANCSNVPGSFSCQCKAGFSGNGTNCTGKVTRTPLLGRFPFQGHNEKYCYNILLVFSISITA